MSFSFPNPLDWITSHRSTLEEAIADAKTKLIQANEHGLDEESVLIYETVPVARVYLSGEVVRLKS